MIAGKALVADDEKEFCIFLKSCLNRCNFDVDVAYDGLEAKDLLLKNDYNFIFFDCNMPGLSGVELAGVIRDSNLEAKKIMITGYGVVDEDFINQFGIDVFLSKPIYIKDIERVVQNGR